MPNFLLHLWAVPPANLQLTCPAPPPGMDPDPVGFFAPESVSGAFSLTGYVSLGIVVALVLVTYLTTRGSLSPRFVWRWWIALLVTAVLCLAAAAVILHWYPTHAMIGSCETNTTGFLEGLPAEIIWDRAFAGFAWGALTFALLSILLTRTIGRWPWSSGFFHFRGCPVPRFLP